MTAESQKVLFNFLRRWIIQSAHYTPFGVNGTDGQVQHVMRNDSWETLADNETNNVIELQVKIATSTNHSFMHYILFPNQFI